MEVETILGFIALACFVLALFIVLVARIVSARQNRAKRKEKAEELTRIYVNTAIQRLKVSGLNAGRVGLMKIVVVGKEGRRIKVIRFEHFSLLLFPVGNAW